MTQAEKQYVYPHQISLLVGACFVLTKCPWIVLSFLETVYELMSSFVFCLSYSLWKSWKPHYLCTLPPCLLTHNGKQSHSLYVPCIFQQLYLFVWFHITSHLLSHLQRVKYLHNCISPLKNVCFACSQKIVGVSCLHNHVASSLFFC